MSLVLWTFACYAYAAPKVEAAKVRSIIDKVNNTFPKDHHWDDGQGTRDLF